MMQTLAVVEPWAIALIPKLVRLSAYEATGSDDPKVAVAM